MSGLNHLGLPTSLAVKAAPTVSFDEGGDDANSSDEEDDEKKKKPKKKVKTGGFQSYELPPFLFKAVMGMGFQLPTPVQRAAIPAMLAGRDLIAMARTGSGKTAAFLIPLLVRLCKHASPSSQHQVRAIILSPTRELAEQTHQVAQQLTKYFPANVGFRSTLLVGGASINQQFESLDHKPCLIVATPGRLLHHLIEVGFSLRYVEMLVFDEADRLLELGFAPQISEIVKKMSDTRQTALISATLPEQLIAFARLALKEPHIVKLDKEQQISPELKLGFISCRTSDKTAALTLALRTAQFDAPKTVLVFAATRHRVEFLHSVLTAAGIESAPVYGQLDPAARKINVAKFKAGRVRVLIVTDVAARGVDLPFLDCVINYDFPPKPKLFVHRVGRVARAGRPGCALCFINAEEMPYMLDLHLFLSRTLSIATDENNVSARPEDIDCMYGEMEALELSDEVSYINDLVSMGELERQQLVGTRSYQLYQKTRPAASNASAARAKLIPTPSIHPWFKLTNRKPSSSQPGLSTITKISTPDEEADAITMLRAIKSFKSNTTIFELHGVDKEHAVHAIKKQCDIIQRKRKIAAENEMHKPVHSTPAVELEEVESGPKSKRPRVEAVSHRDSTHFISMDRSSSDALESGLSMELGSGAGLAQLSALSMDMIGDEANVLMKGRTKSTWDQKRRNYVKTNEGGDPFKAQRNKDGDLVRAKDQPALYEKWQKTKKAKAEFKSRLTEMNERDEDNAGGANEGGKPRVQRASFGGKSELRNTEEIRKQRVQREKNKVKHAAKQKAKKGGSFKGKGKRA